MPLRVKQRLDVESIALLVLLEGIQGLGMVHDVAKEVGGVGGLDVAVGVGHLDDLDREKCELRAMRSNSRNSRRGWYVCANVQSTG